MDELALQVKFHIVVDKIQSREENLFARKNLKLCIMYFQLHFLGFAVS